MGFMDIINKEQERMKNMQGDNNSVKYPQTKHERLFLSNKQGQGEYYLQILPSADLYSEFAKPVRKIFITAKSSQGKEMNINFTLSAEGDEGSLLENKIVEWQQEEMMTNSFGTQQNPTFKFLLNVVKVFRDQQGNWFQERDDQGQLMVRVFEMHQSAFNSLIENLKDPMNNSSGSELSFLDPQQASPIRVAKPAKGQTEAPFNVYPHFTLPPLEQGWEQHLENLDELATPTERLEGGYDWVQAFVDMKEGRKPNQNRNEDNQGQSSQPQGNPYGNQNPNQAPPQQQAPQGNPNPNPNQGYNQAPQGNPNPNPNPGQAPSQGFNSQAPQGNPNPNPNPNQGYNQAPQQQAPQQQAPQQQAPQQNQNGFIGEDVNAEGQSTNNNNNGHYQAPAQNSGADKFNDLDAMLEEELNGGN